MKWIVAEKIIDHEHMQENDNGDLVPTVTWVRLEDVEFASRSEVNSWIESKEIRTVEDGTNRYEARRIDERLATIDELGVTGTDLDVIRHAAGIAPIDIVGDEHAEASIRLAERGLLSPDGLVLTDTGKRVMRIQ